MQLYQLFSFVLISWLSNHVTLSSQHKPNVEQIRFSVKQDRLNMKQLKARTQPRRQVDPRPGMVPERQLKKPVELMSEDEFKVTKMTEVEQRYIVGGQQLQPTPEQLTVTDEMFFEIEIDNFKGDGEPLKGNITIACFGRLTPIACLNFVSITKGYRKGKNRMSYKNGHVSKVIRDFMIQMGDTNEGGNDSIFGKNFADESFAISHNRAGWVGMANFGKDSNGSQFYVLLRTSRWLDGKHVIFGKVLQGMEFIQKIGNQDTDSNNSPLNNIKIVNCGSLKLKKAYTLSEAEFNTDEDVKRIEQE